MDVETTSVVDYDEETTKVVIKHAPSNYWITYSVNGETQRTALEFQRAIFYLSNH